MDAIGSATISKDVMADCDLVAAGPAGLSEMRYLREHILGGHLLLVLALVPSEVDVHLAVPLASRLVCDPKPSATLLLSSCMRAGTLMMP